MYKNSPQHKYDRRRNIKGYVAYWTVFILLFVLFWWVVKDILSWPVYAQTPMTNEQACKDLRYQQSEEVKSYCLGLTK